ncbi:MAG: hypothetical protein O2800_05125 [Planctomycetota bacterium]|nr:hypothetical protein [Planctomycetota bacterium]
MKIFIRLLLTLAMTASIEIVFSSAALAASMQDSTTLRLPSGTNWVGKVGDRVEIKARSGSAVSTIVGVVTRLTSSMIEVSVAEASGSTSRKSVLVKAILRISTVEAAVVAAATTTAPTDAGAASAAATSATPSTSTTTAGEGAKKEVFILPMDGTVGIGLRHDEIDEIAKIADTFGPGQIIVLKINSNGGLVVEGDDIHDSLKEIKKHHRVVAWIEKAISGAAFTALHADEVYFMSHGSLGSITMFGGDKSATGRELEAWLVKVGEGGEIGGRWGHIIKCMVYSPLLLSYDKDPVTGKVTWYDTLEGEFQMSNEKENLDFNAQNGLHSRFSDGTAETVEDLMKMMNLDGRFVVNLDGQKIYEKWQKLLKDADEEIPLLKSELNYKGTGSGDPMKILQSRLAIVNKLIQWSKRLGERVAGVEHQLSVKQLEQAKEQLQRELKNARQQGNT